MDEGAKGEEGRPGLLRTWLLAHQEEWPAVSGSPEQIVLLVLYQRGQQIRALTTERDGLQGAVREAMEWYGERAAAIQRYLEAKPPNTTAVMAVVTELSLDAGGRAKKTLSLPSVQQAVGKEGKP